MGELSRKDYEKLINSSNLFTLDRDKDVNEYKRERIKMIEYLYLYITSVKDKEKREKLKDYACEIVETASFCIDNFDRSRGEFLHYFNSTWKIELSHITGREIDEKKYRGVNISKKARSLVVKYLKLADECGSEYTREELLEHLSMAEGIPVEKLRKIAVIASISVGSDTYVNEDGEEQSILDIFSESSSPEEDYCEAESIIDILKAVDAVFDSLQERQKPVISDMLTCRLCSFISEYESADYHFVSKDILDSYKEGQRVPTQRELAVRYGCKESSLSRTIAGFEKKLRERIGN